MSYILCADGRDDDPFGAFARYRVYLEANRANFPKNAFELATSSWYYGFDDHRAPHDAWLEKLEIDEAYTPETAALGPGRRERNLSIRLRLLGAYHDGYIEIRYPRVFRYALNIEHGAHGQRDWRYDELRVSETGTLIHEIEWCGARDIGTWLIEASDIEFTWFPISAE